MRRLSILMNAATFNNTNGAVDRQAGFSDSWYQVPGDSFLLQPSDIDLINKRSALLPRTSTVVGARISDVDIYGKTTGKTRLYRMSIAGGQNLECDDPRVSLIYEADAAGFPNEFSLFIQNVPDIRVVKGTFNPATTWTTPLNAYLASVQTGNYGFVGYNLTYPKIGVKSIKTVAGVTTVTCENAVAALDGFYVRFLRTTAWSKYKPAPNGYPVLAVTGTTTFTIGNWTRKDVDGNVVALPDSAGGIVTKWGKQFYVPSFTDYTKGNPCAGTRKVGRPFFQYRGRASAHRS